MLNKALNSSHRTTESFIPKRKSEFNGPVVSLVRYLVSIPNKSMFLLDSKSSPVWQSTKRSSSTSRNKVLLTMM